MNDPSAVRRSPPRPQASTRLRATSRFASCAITCAIACDLSSSSPTLSTQSIQPVVAVTATNAGSVGGDSDATQIVIQAGVPSATHCLTVMDYNNCYFYIIAAIGPSGPVPPPTITAGGTDTASWEFTTPGWSIELGAFSASDSGNVLAQMSGSVTQPSHGSADTVQVLWWAWSDSQVGQTAYAERLVPTVKPKFQAATPIELACVISVAAGTCSPVVSEAERRP